MPPQKKDITIVTPTTELLPRNQHGDLGTKCNHTYVKKEIDPIALAYFHVVKAQPS
jgi:hypothetical protein